MPPIHAIVAYSKPTVKAFVLRVLHCRLPTYREVDIGNWWSSCHKNLDNLCMSCPGCQVKWAGTLVISAITWCLVAEQQLHDVSEIYRKRRKLWTFFFEIQIQMHIAFFFWWILKLVDDEENDGESILKKLAFSCWLSLKWTSKWLATVYW